MQSGVRLRTGRAGGCLAGLQAMGTQLLGEYSRELLLESGHGGDASAAFQAVQAGL